MGDYPYGMTREEYTEVCRYTQEDYDKLETALVDIFRIATHELTVQSRLSAAGPGAKITQRVFDVLGAERLEQLLRSE